jgi:pyruvyl transferase EpsO
VSSNDIVSKGAEQLIASFKGTVPGSPTLALIGFPDHADCGDHAVWLGVKALIGRSGHASPGGAVAYQCSAASYDPVEMRAKLGDGTILFQGHGPSRAALELRKRVLEDFPNRKAIVLPQLVSEPESEALKRWSQEAGQADLTFFAAGKKSEALLKRHFDPKRVVLAADAAFLLGEEPRPAKPLYDIVWVARTDEERSDEETEAAARLSSQGAEKFELPRFPDGIDINLVVKQRPPTVLLTDWHSLFFENEQARLAIRRLEFDARSEVYVARALHLLSLAHVVITDRVHAHLLCVLLKVPHVLIDTASGKNADFHATWTAESPLVKLAQSPAEAWMLARNAAAKIKAFKNGDREWSWENSGINP